MGLRHAERVQGAHALDLQRVNGMSQVVSGTRRRGEVQHEIDRAVDEEWRGDVLPHEPEAGVAGQMAEIPLAPGEQVVDPHDAPAPVQEPVAQVGAQKSSRAGDDDRPG